MVSYENLRKCNIKVEDITNTRTFTGPNRSRLKGGANMQKPEWVDSEYTAIPRHFYELHRFFALAEGMMSVNGSSCWLLNQEILE